MKKFLSLCILVAIMIFCSIKILKVNFPLTYIDTVNRYATEYKIDKYLILSIIKAESGFDKNAKSKANAQGLMQVTEDTASFISHKLGDKYTKLLDIDTNIKFGTWYFRYLLDKYDNDERLALAAYNAGFGNVDKWELKSGFDISEIKFPETKEYVKRVELYYSIYKKLYRGE